MKKHKGKHISKKKNVARKLHHQKREKHAEKHLDLPAPVILEKPIRVFRPRINLQACKSEFNCIVYCPHNAIKRDEKGKPHIDYGLCTGCLICLRECPNNAIIEEREE